MQFINLIRAPKISYSVPIIEWLMRVCKTLPSYSMDNNIKPIILSLHMSDIQFSLSQSTRCEF